MSNIVCQKKLKILSAQKSVRQKCWWRNWSKKNFVKRETTSRTIADLVGNCLFLLFLVLFTIHFYFFCQRRASLKRSSRKNGYVVLLSLQKKFHLPFGICWWDRMFRMISEQLELLWNQTRQNKTNFRFNFNLQLRFSAFFTSTRLENLMIDFECAKSWWDLLSLSLCKWRSIQTYNVEWSTLTPSQPSAVSLVYKTGCTSVLCVSVCVYVCDVIECECVSVRECVCACVYVCESKSVHCACVLYLCSDFGCVQHLRQRDYNVTPITFKVVPTFSLQMTFNLHLWNKNK